MILKQLLVLYIFILAGYFFGKLKKGLTAQTGIISFLLVNLFLPCKVLLNFSDNVTVSYLKNNWLTLVISIGFLLLLVLCARIISPIMTKNEYEQRVYRYSLAIANYAYMGYALVESIYGEQGLTNLILFCIPFAFYTYTFGYAILTGKGGSFKKLLNPMTAAIVIGIVIGITGFDIPDAFSSIMSSASSCVAPLSMILTGFVLSEFSVKELVANRNAYIFTALRLVGFPLLVFAVSKLLGLFVTLPDAVYPSVVIMAAMPCGLNTVVFPKLIGEDCRIGARLAFISNIVSCVTIPFWLTIVS